MLKKIIKNLFRKFGFELARIPLTDTSKSFTLYRFLDKNGLFDYKKYCKIQTEGNKRKLSNVWVLEENIAFLSEYIKNNAELPKFGICHGTRRGKEQEWFRKYLGCEVIGTEISDTAEQFPNTIQWDFHKIKPEWINTVDFIYSNSFDHSYNPEQCLNAWMSCIKKGGLCIIEHSSLHDPKGVSTLDPFGADIVQMPYLITIWGKGRYGVRYLIEAPKKNAAVRYLYFIVIQKF